MIDFTKLSLEDLKLVVKISQRANFLLGYNELDVQMDVAAVHLTMPMDLTRLLGASMFHFCLDIVGIKKHLNRQDGSLKHLFVPRFLVVENTIAIDKQNETD